MNRRRIRKVPGENFARLLLLIFGANFIAAFGAMVLESLHEHGDFRQLILGILSLVNGIWTIEFYRQIREIRKEYYGA